MQLAQVRIGLLDQHGWEAVDPFARLLFVYLRANDPTASGVMPYAPDRIARQTGFDRVTVEAAVRALAAADRLRCPPGALWLLCTAQDRVQTPGWYVKALREVVAVGGFGLGASWLEHNRHHLQSLRAPKTPPDTYADAWEALRADEPLPLPWVPRAPAPVLNPDPRSSQTGEKSKQASKQVAPPRDCAHETRGNPRAHARRPVVDAPIATVRDEAVRHLLLVDQLSVREVFDHWCQLLSPMPAPAFSANSWQIAAALNACKEEGWPASSTLIEVLDFCALSRWRSWSNGVDGLTRADALFGVKYGAGRHGDRDAASTISRLRMEAASWRSSEREADPDPVDDPEALALIPKCIANGFAEDERTARQYLRQRGWRLGAEAA